MRCRPAILATALTSLPVAILGLSSGAAQAQPISGPYISLGAGLHAPGNPQATVYGPGWGSSHVHLNQNLGFNAQGAVGYGIGNGFRFEIEGDFMRSTLRSIGGTPFPTSSSGTIRTWGVMGNAIYDLDIGVPWLFPYIGAGAGYQWTSLNSFSSVQTGGPFKFGTNGSQAGTFAWQAIAGLSFPIPNMPGLSLTADYRFMEILGGEKFYGLSAVPGGKPVSSELKLHNQFNNEFIFGVRYAFNVPRPMPPATPVAVPAPTPARSYLVFFDWDKATLSDRARAIVKEAADSSTRVQVTRIEVNGYTDTSGTPQYNMGLSMRRANAVASELVRNGVAKEAISIQGFGETHLLVPTGSGVREPQNRRVEIIIK